MLASIAGRALKAETNEPLLLECPCPPVSTRTAMAQSAQSTPNLASSAQSMPNCSAEQPAKWQVKFPSGWMDLPSDASQAIEAARHDGKAVAEYSQCRSDKKEWWDPYRIVFSTMQQKNLRSGRIREARRVMEPAPHVRRTTPSEDKEPPREGVWAEPEEEKKGANKISRTA